MTGISFVRNVGAFIRGLPALVNTSRTTGNDGVAINGATIDRNTLATAVRSAKLVVLADAVLGTGETLTLRGRLEDSANGSSWAALAGETPADVVETLTGLHVAGFDFNIEGARRYIRAVVTPTLSASASDTVDVAAVLVVGGAYETPINEA